MKLAICDVPLSAHQALRIQATSALSLPLRCLTSILPRKPRQFVAFGIGAPRTGTTSLASLLAKNFRTLHEPHYSETVLHLLRYLEGQISTKTFCRLLLCRDSYLNLELESSHFLHHCLDLLVELFPDAKFILTVRHPRPWLESEMNQNIISQHFPVWRRLERFRYNRYGEQFPEEERGLENVDGVYPISSYLRYWTDHNKMALQTVPPGRLLVLETGSLTKRAGQIAQFLNIPESSLNTRESHQNQNKQKQLILEEHVPESYLSNLIERHCEPLIHHFQEHHQVCG